MTSRQAGKAGVVCRRSLAARILVGVTAAVGGVLLVALAYFSFEQRAALDRVFEKQNQSLTDSLAAFSIEQLIAFDYPALEYAISAAGRQNDSILFIEIEHGGRAVARVGRGAVGREFAAPIARTESGGEAIGQVRMVFSTHDHDLLKAAALRNGLAIMLLIFAAMIGSLRWLLRRTVIVPIEQLTLRTEQAIAAALPELPELAASDRPASADEVQLLDQRFRSLLDGLKRRDAARDQAEKALVDYQDNLEKLIDERTRELRLAREESDRLNQVKSEFLAAASHDLRQPLQAITLFHSVLRKTPLNDEQVRIVNSLSMSLTSLGDLLNALLDVSKLDAGHVKPALAALPAVDLLRRVDAEFAPLAAAKGLRFKLFFPFDEVVLHSDAKLLLSMLNNLVGNAVKYTDRGGILVSVRRRGGQALVQVWDTGVGIDAENVGKIYDEYFQIGNPQRDRTKGLGLGLAIVRRLARLLGTEISCRSLPGRGSVFSFVLPLATSVAPPLLAPAARPPVLPADAMQGARVVMVEDDLMLASALQVAFEARGISVRVFASAEAALAERGIETADYFLSDFRLPGIDGLQMLDLLQRRARHRLNAVLLTGDTSPERIRMAEASGWPVFFKPVDFDSVLLAWYSSRQPQPATLSA